ncbi:hypothetical protein SYNPS1DRAFT_33143 [Syncephalis pseudoplumigaleata]|uniref:Kynurenine 3-monooxygenase n=1 Tax=Syncephalis pseudoplumigaleata TaxID=1712513 RepID=A0A4P9YXI2_9FUNG|nr:hypothetical protein SYNPS1DRAFT_33143 [Syncephalis pseudoplumigaleata]|eukprot:RKP24767.1 hypothetical protein SYNPS1DRAFT_33143 [Syncephalis pseudoplumigaleata]
MAIAKKEAGTPQSVAVVGAGPVGALAALYMAQLGWRVSLYEARSDIRKEQVYHGRSINLALSTRGILALRGTKLNLDEEVLREAIPMRGRMIHDQHGRQSSQAYGVHGEASRWTYINSVDRGKLNCRLLDAAEKHPNIKLKFGHKVVHCQPDLGALVVETGTDDARETFTISHDFIIGADGAFSTIRRALMRCTRMDYQQAYIPHCYRELTIQARVDAEGNRSFAMDPYHLHIWPKMSYMMIALPNTDQSFTCTLFMPQEKFDAIRSQQQLVEFFQQEFPDAYELIGRESLCEEYFRNPLGSLISIKCKPYHYQDKMVIIGDAAHSMVPFYGQGMNAGMEDVMILQEMLLRYQNSLSDALDAYTALRHDDAVAICDLAMYNYVEMRAHVHSPVYRARKAIEGVLYRLMPSYVVPLYTMVSFTTIRYSEATRRSQRQGRWIYIASGVALAVTLGLAFAATTISLSHHHRRHRQQAPTSAA